jgi:hypothetical protein
MSTRHELAYAVWYILLFATVVGWAALRQESRSGLPEATTSGNRPDIAEHETEMRRMTQRMMR